MKRLALFLLIFSFPFQLGAHFWPSWSSVSGFHIDYLSPTIYLTDLFLIFYLLTSRPRVPKLPTLSLLIFALLNILFSHSIPLSTYSWCRLSLYLLLFLSLRQEKDLVQKIRIPLLLSTTLILGLELLQFIFQSSLGGPFYLLGERTLNVASPNVAKLDFLNHLILRPYSTFSHPNSLAGYLLLVYLLIPRLREFIIAGIFFTFSKTAIVALLLAKFFIKFTKPIVIFFILISLLPLSSSLAPVPFIPSSSLLTRLYLGIPTAQIIYDHPITGVGFGNFIPSMVHYLPASHQIPSSLQPVHSFILLIISELGLIVLLPFIYLIKRFSLSSQFLTILAVTGSLDHYWWTLPQNRLILVVCLAIFLKTHDSPKNHHQN